MHRLSHSFHAVVDVTENNSKLQTLRIEQTLLVEEVKMLATGFSHHPTLRRVTLPPLSLPPDATVKDTDIASDTGILDPLLQALATIPNLEAIEFFTSSSTGSSRGSSANASSDVLHVTAMATTVITPATFAALTSHSTLIWHVTRRCQLHNAHVQAMANAWTHAPCFHLKDMNLSTNNGIEKRCRFIFLQNY
jgi:hypothetical protein